MSKRKADDKVCADAEPITKKPRNGSSMDDSLEDISDDDFLDDLSSIINEFSLADEVGEVELVNFESMLERALK